jgi:hypothetical protein
MNGFRLLLGIVLTLWGVMVMLRPKFYHSGFGRFFDFTGYHIPFGLFVVGMGILFVWTTLRNMRRKKD